MNDAHFEMTRLVICFLNVVLGLLSLKWHAEVYPKAIAGILIVGLGPLAWNRWLYGELFSTGSPSLSWRLFERIGLLASISVFAVIVHSITTT